MSAVNLTHKTFPLTGGAEVTSKRRRSLSKTEKVVSGCSQAAHKKERKMDKGRNGTSPASRLSKTDLSGSGFIA